MKNVKPEFQAILMAGGKGSRMPELASGIPRCLLPVGNKPIVWYPLNLLEASGFTDVIMVIPESQKVEIQKTLEKNDLKIKIDYVLTSSTEDLGTADSLRLVSDKITGDLIILSCDIITDCPLDGIFNIFRKHNASLVSVLFDTSKSSEHNTPITIPGPKSKVKVERDLIGIDTNTSRLVFQASSSDFDTTVAFSKKMFKKHPNFTLFSRLLDSHIYVMKHWVLKYINYEKKFSTIKGEVVPHVVKKQLTKIPTTHEHDKNHSVLNAEVRNDIFEFAKSDTLEEKVREMSSYNDHFGDVKSAYHGDVIKCYSFIPNNFGLRVNSLATFCLANTLFFDKFESITKNSIDRIHSTATVETKQLDERSLVGDGSVISERTSIKNTYIGSNCMVQNKVRLQDCILMNNVKINEKCVLINCILCDGVVIEEEVELKNCLVGNNHTIPTGSQHSSEIITADDKLMEI